VNGVCSEVLMASLVMRQVYTTWVVAKRLGYEVSGAYRVVGTRPGGAQVGLPVCFVVLVPWLVVLSRVEPVGTWSSMTWRFA
jgi:hypothetical protein